MKKYPTKKRGFTLVELMVVIVIIGILSSIVVAAIQPARKNARDAQRQTDIAQIAIALKLYKEKNGEYPNVARPGGDPDDAQVLGYGYEIDDALSPFLDNIPKDPLSSNDSGEYNYFYDRGHDCGVPSDPVRSKSIVFANSMEVESNSNLGEACNNGAEPPNNATNIFGPQGMAGIPPSNYKPYINLLDLRF